MNASACCPVVELRQYTLVPGKREKLIALFEQEFIESQESTGMIVVGQFRDLNNPNRFVWIRGFNDMTSRASQLQEFYGGPVWKKNREAANATMIDSDNVLLLRPAFPNSGFCLEHASRPTPGSRGQVAGLLVATIYHLGTMAGAAFADFFAGNLQSILTEAGVSVLASFVTETHSNTFPALPVREDANVFIWFSSVANGAIHEQRKTRIADLLRQKKTGRTTRESCRLAGGIASFADNSVASARKSFWLTLKKSNLKPSFRSNETKQKPEEQIENKSQSSWLVRDLCSRYRAGQSLLREYVSSNSRAFTE